mgnify:CR=1 FL=1
MIVPRQAQSDIGRLAEMLRRVKGRIRAMKGTFSGGTAASGRALFEAAAKDPGILALMRDPFALTPGFRRRCVLQKEFFEIEEALYRAFVWEVEVKSHREWER